MAAPALFKRCSTQRLIKPPTNDVILLHVSFKTIKKTFDLDILRIHWRLSMILKLSNKSVWSNVFWSVKVGILWKCIQYTTHWYKTNVKKNSFGQNKRYKKCPLFSFVSSNSRQFYFNLRILYKLKHKVCDSKTVRGIFHFRFVFAKVCIFVQQRAWILLSLRHHNSFQN